MSPLTLHSAAIDDAVDGLLDLYLLVCDPQGGMVAGLPADAFTCTASVAAGQPVLLREGVVEDRPGCYRLAFHHEPQVRVDLLTVSVHQRRRTNPIGLAPVLGTIAQGHVLVALNKPRR